MKLLTAALTIVIVTAAVLFSIKTIENKRLINGEYGSIVREYKDKKPAYWGENAPGVKTKIKTNEKIIAVTLDACGSKTDSLDENLIEFLTREKIQATMFIAGRWIKKYPEKFKRLAGNPLFEIENHGTNHLPASINGKSVYNIKGTGNVVRLIKEIRDNAVLIEKLTGKKTLFYRSGTAFYDEYAVQIANGLNHTVIGFSVLGDKGATYNAEEVENALLSAKSGDILIFHMNHPEKETGKGLIRGIPKLKEKGFAFVKLSDYKDKLY